MRRSLVPVAALAAALALPAAASAQVPTPPPPAPTPVPTPTPAPVPPPPPAKAALHLSTAKVLRDGKRRVQVTGRSFRVRGTLTPYVAGQKVRVNLMRGGKLVRRLHPRLRRGPSGRSGVFRVTIKRSTAAGYALRAVHARTAQQARGHSNKVRVKLIDGSIAFGHGGAGVRLLQRGLRRMHYPATSSGVYDDATSRAVMAWRKVTGAPRTFTADRSVLLGVLDGKGRWKVRHPHDGRHVEADLSMQVLVLVDGAKVVRIQHTSSGKPSTPTILGRFRVYRKDFGTNSEGMVDSNYFIRGYAIHGYYTVPTYNASHGCLRVPIADALTIYNWLHYGDVVWVEP
jgi:lipoprotein-anchoring transpeptidase ErfK/SrfK